MQEQEEGVCIGWGLGLRGLGSNFDSPPLLRVMWDKQPDLFEHQFPPRFEDVEITNMSQWRDGE